MCVAATRSASCSSPAAASVLPGGDPRNPEIGTAFQLSLTAEHLFTHRVWLGIVGVLAQLDATVAIRAELTCWLVGFEPHRPEFAACPAKSAHVRVVSLSLLPS